MIKKKKKKKEKHSVVRRKSFEMNSKGKEKKFCVERCD